MYLKCAHSEVLVNLIKTEGKSPTKDIQNKSLYIFKNIPVYLKCHFNRLEIANTQFHFGRH